MSNFYFFSRRAYNRSTQKFTNGFADLTRFVELDNVSHTVATGNIIDRGDWARKVKAKAGTGAVLCFVHGFNTPQIDMLRRQKAIQNGLNAAGWNGVVIAFDWPHKPGITNYRNARTLAKKSAPFFVAEGLEPLLGGGKVHVIAHSMGCLVTIRGFAQTRDAGPTPWRLDQVLLVSADVNDEELAKGTGHADAMDKRSARLTNYYSNQDRVLKLSENIVSGGRDRLGFDGIPTQNGPGFADVACGTRYHQSIPKPSDPFEEQIFSHTWYFSDDRFYRDAKDTLNGRATNDMGNTRGISGGGPDQALKP